MSVRFIHCLQFIAAAAILTAKLAAAAPADPSPDQKHVAALPAAKQSAKADSYGIAIVAHINDEIRQGWEAHQFAPSPPASDAEWCRRVFLDVLGRVPTVDELDRFLSDSTKQKKRQLVDRLLGDEYVEEYARNWTTLWTNILIGRSGGTEQNRMTSREGLQQALRRAMQKDMPYDRLAFELIAAQGVNTPGAARQQSDSQSGGDAEHYNGFVNFLAGKLEENGAQATAKTAQIFLGLQVQCTQCHNHPFNDWKQNQFWELNAFFRQTKALRRYEGGRDVASVELVNQDFAGEDGKVDEAALFYELRNGRLQAAYPVFVDGAKLKSSSGYLDDVDRRTELAKLVVKSDYLSLAVVNRYWAHFLGYGFTKPLDDMGPHNAPTHPALLASLAKEFREHSHDLKQLIRWIVLSEPYGLSSRFSATNKKDDPTLGEKPMFSRFYLRQMRVEELYNSLLVATEAHKTQSSYEEQEKTKRDWLSQFVIAFGTDENDETTTFNGTIPQSLMMMNGDLMKKAISIDKGSFLERVATDGKMNNAAKINHLFEAALARRPTSNEAGVANKLLVARKGDAAAALQDAWWALLNSNEFILNH